MSSGHGGRGLDRWQPYLDKMKINLHMLGALMLNGVGRDVHNTDIVTVDKCAPRRQGPELME
jgi:hypothetical protein